VDSFTAYRAAGQPAFRLSRGEVDPNFESDYETGRAPRGPQARSAVIHMGLSMWSSEESARAKNVEFGGRLGDHIVALELDGELGVWWAQTFSPHHMTVWGHPADASSASSPFSRNAGTVTGRAIMTYGIFNLASGNLIESVDSEPEALAFVSSLLNEKDVNVNQIGLSIVDKHGHTVTTLHGRKLEDAVHSGGIHADLRA
jgi:hypothetical protein